MYDLCSASGLKMAVCLVMLLKNFFLLPEARSFCSLRTAPVYLSNL